jgi:hypothetical protein
MTYAQARRWWRKREHDKKKGVPEKVHYATTSPRVDGALWRDIGGVTHVVWGWHLETYQQVTSCGQAVRYRRGDWLYEALGLAATYPNCVHCASYCIPNKHTWRYYGTTTGRMSYGGSNLIRKQGSIGTIL